MNDIELTRKTPDEAINQTQASEQDSIKNSSPQLSHHQKAIIRLAYDTGHSMLIFGGAGTGKSVLIDGLAQYYCDKGKYVLLTAFTGIAANNIGGTTLHHLFRLKPFFQNAACSNEKLYGILEEMIWGAAALIIDEDSMVRADVLDKINVILQQIMGNQFPFGGKQIIMVGDFCQLAPFASSPDEKRLIDNTYGGPWVFNAPCYGETPWMSIELTEYFRQTDPRQIEILERIRRGNVDQALVDELNAMCYRPVPDDHPFPILCSTNEEVAEENQKRYQQLDPSTEHVYSCKYTKALHENNIDKDIHLRIGAKVMMVTNDPLQRWFNGTVGTITGLTDDKIFVTIDDTEYQVNRVEFFRYEYHKAKDNTVTAEKVDVTHQFPVRYGWAATIHKAQGMTLDGAYLAKKGKAFTHAQIYVALSRVRDLRNLWLYRPLELEEIMTDQHALNVMQHAIESERARGYVPALMEEMETLEFARESFMKNKVSSRERIFIHGRGASMLGILLGTRNRGFTVVCNETDPAFAKSCRAYIQRYRTVNIQLAKPKDMANEYDTVVDLDDLINETIRHNENGEKDYSAFFEKRVNNYYSILADRGRLILLEKLITADSQDQLTAMMDTCIRNSFILTEEPVVRSCRVRDTFYDFACTVLIASKHVAVPDEVW